MRRGGRLPVSRGGHGVEGVEGSWRWSGCHAKGRWGHKQQVSLTKRGLSRWTRGRERREVESVGG
jgi:hypothetical protein